MTLPDMNGGAPFVDGDPFTAAHANSARVSITRAVDGTSGGSFAPSPAITIAGDGLTVSGQFTSSGAMTSTGGIAMTGTLSGTITQTATVSTSGQETRTGIYILSGASATTRRRFTKKGVLAANDTVDLTADVFSFSDPSADIDVSINYASGGSGFEIECFSTAVTAVKFIQFKFSGSNIAKFPAGATSAWVKFIYDGLLWYVSAYGGGTTV